MSVDKIVDYVVKTPHNTNPNVIRSLVKSEVDENTLQKAKEYTDSQRLAYSENVGVAIFSDYVTSRSGKTVESLGLIPGKSYKITVSGESSVSVAKEGTKYINGVETPGVRLEAEVAGVDVQVFDQSDINETQIIALPYRDEPFITIYKESETIHPIDPKYLPEGVGGGLPVVDISMDDALTILDSIGDNMAQLPENMEKSLNTAIAAGLPCIARIINTDEQGNVLEATVCNLGTVKAAELEVSGYHMAIKLLGLDFWALRLPDYWGCVNTTAVEGA